MVPGGVYPLPIFVSEFVHICKDIVFQSRVTWHVAVGVSCELMIPFSILARHSTRNAHRKCCFCRSEDSVMIGNDCPYYQGGIFNSDTDKQAWFGFLLLALRRVVCIKHRASPFPCPLSSPYPYPYPNHVRIHDRPQTNL